MKSKIIYIALGVIVCIFTFSVMTLNSNVNERTVTTSGAVLDNKKIGWGIKRAGNQFSPTVKEYI